MAYIMREITTKRIRHLSEPPFTTVHPGCEVIEIPNGQTATEFRAQITGAPHHHAYEDSGRIVPSGTPEVLAELWPDALVYRDGRLTASAWSQLPDAQATMTPEEKAAWAAYRGVLRGIKQTAQDPRAIVWPKAPK